MCTLVCIARASNYIWYYYIVLLHVVLPVVQWDASATILLNESTNGSCTASGNPRPLANVTFPSNCYYHTKSIIVNHFTTRVEFSIPHITRDCEYGFCHTPGYLSPNFTRRLNITGKASTHSYHSKMIMMSFYFSF